MAGLRTQPTRTPSTNTQKTNSSAIAVAEHCPPGLLKGRWGLDAFDIRAKMYKGNISSVYRAVDRQSGITVGAACVVFVDDVVLCSVFVRSFIVHNNIQQHCPTKHNRTNYNHTTKKPQTYT